ncbi:MAG: Ig-like domain-containing protein [Lachnospiraceae bacterium]|jgi:uncharacterized protein YjdB|nr:Ig-like domain-containing protein [Lachnospiraceae bacterium]
MLIKDYISDLLNSSKINRLICFAGIVCLAVSIAFAQHVYASSSASNLQNAGDTNGAQYTTVPVDIDLGDYRKEMIVGESQLLSVTILPETVIDKAVSFSSSNEAVASINMLGRISALSVGTAIIVVQAGEVEKEIQIAVKSPETTPFVPVTNIEVVGLKDTLKVDETIELSATVLPQNATNKDIVFSSSNNTIATVSSNGQIKGIAQGQAVITASVGEFCKSWTITVKKQTQSINVKKEYIIMKVAETYQLGASVLPKDADQALTYETTQPEILQVSSKGVVTAKSKGSGSVIISSWDSSKVVTIIVNDTSDSDESQTNNVESEKLVVEPPNIYSEEIKNAKSGDRINFSGEELPVITESLLKLLYEKDITLCVDYQDYIVSINGKDIKNVENSLNTFIEFNIENGGLSFVVNNEKNLPGKVEIEIHFSEEYPYLYLYNKTKGRYENVNAVKGDILSIDHGGQWLITSSKLTSFEFTWKMIVFPSALFIGLLTVYLMRKKKHWFW